MKKKSCFWPRHSFLRYPGTIAVEFLDPIPKGLPRKEFMEKLESSIEKASEKLLREALEDFERKGLTPPVPRLPLAASAH